MHAVRALSRRQILRLTLVVNSAAFDVGAPAAEGGRLGVAVVHTTAVTGRNIAAAPLSPHHCRRITAAAKLCRRPPGRAVPMPAPGLQLIPVEGLGQAVGGAGV